MKLLATLLILMVVGVQAYAWDDSLIYISYMECGEVLNLKRGCVVIHSANEPEEDFTIFKCPE